MSGKKLYFIIGAVIFVLSFILGMNLKKTFQSETDLLLVCKPSFSCGNLPSALGNAKQIPLSVSFYEKLAGKENGLGDDLAELPAYKKKLEWQKKLNVEFIKNTTVVRIVGLDADQWKAEELSQKVSEDLKIVLGKYYANLEIKTIDGPITRSVNQSDWRLVGVVSLLLALAGGILSFFAARLFSNFGNGQNALKIPGLDLSKIGGLINHKTREENVFDQESLKKGEFFFPVPELKKEAPKEKTNGSSVKAAAPFNLPVASEEKTSPAEEKRAYREATPEEVKERLNKLLKGRL